MPQSREPVPAVSNLPAVTALPAVLVVTAEPALADELRRLCAAAGVGSSVSAAPPPLDAWLAGRLVLIGADRARSVHGAGHPRRPGVVLVTDDPDDADVWQHAVQLGAEQVAVLPDSREWLVERVAGAVERGGAGRVVGVVGGCGGGGASTWAAALAVGAALTDRRVLLADLDPLGGGADLMLGVDDVPGLRWGDLAGARGRLPSGSVRDALPRLDALAVLTYGEEPVDLPVRAVEAVLTAATRAHDLVVVDLPRCGDDAAAVAMSRLDELHVVVPARLRAVAAAAALVARLGPAAPPLHVVVRQGSGDTLPPGRVAEAVGAPLCLQMDDEPRLDVLAGRGEAPGLRRRGPLARAVERWLARGALERAA